MLLLFSDGQVPIAIRFKLQFSCVRGFDLTTDDLIGVHEILDSIQFANFCDSIWRWKIWGWNLVRRTLRSLARKFLQFFFQLSQKAVAQTRTVILCLHHIASSSGSHLPQHSSLMLIATWAKMWCKYLSQPVTTPLTYPNTQSNDIPTLLYLAVKFLSIPATSASVEWLFSVWEQSFVLTASDCQPLQFRHCCLVSKWLNRQQPMQTLPDGYFFAFFQNKTNEQSVVC